MAGITFYGAYVPYNRLDRNKIREQHGISVPKGERAVAGYDEDSLTLGVNSALQCIRGCDTSRLNAVFFATTTSPFNEKQISTTLAAVVNANRNLRTADFGGSLRSGTSAMLLALDMADAGKNVLVTTSDCRLGKAAGFNEAAFGDAAASFIIGNEHVIANVLGSHSIAHDLADSWRTDSDEGVVSWDEKYPNARGYEPFMAEAAKAVMAKCGLVPENFSKLIAYASKPKLLKSIAKKLGFSLEQIQENYFETIGNAGAAQTSLMLVGALEEAKPGDKILLLSYGEGADAIVFEVTEEIKNLIPRKGIQSYLKYKKNSMTYGKYLRWKELLVFEPPRRPNPTRASITAYDRNYDKNYKLMGSKCNECGSVHYPPQRVCSKCNAFNNFEDYRFYGIPAKLTAYTIDHLAFSLDPPTVLAVIDMEGGGRIWTTLVDVDETEIAFNMSVEMSFRKVNDAESVKTYHWKAVPVRD